MGGVFSRKALRRAGAACLIVLGYPAGAWAETDYSHLSIEQLENVEITSVSKRPEPLSQAPAAVYVITAEDIRRSGKTSLPEVLRLAPNLEVARMNAFGYAITARGFNSPESGNKLLVLIDGRSVYSPLASTVFWQNLDIPLSTIDRIEVVSGPGGTLYGANAVNGVINIITRNSAEAQGLSLRIGAGPDDQSATAQYGTSLGENTTIRFHLKTFNRANTDPVSSTDFSKDDWQGTQGGFRLDSHDGSETYFLEGSAYGNQNRETFIEKGWGENLTGSWTHAFSGGSTLVVSGYYDNALRTEPVAKDETTTYDIQAQHTTSFGWNDVFIWGGEYRVWDEAFYSLVPFTFAKPRTTISLGSLFGQDELPIASDLKLTVGLKAEDNSYSGLDLLPNIRLAWQQSQHTLFWASVSRAVRTPSKIDRELEDPGLLLPSPEFRSEKLTAYEAGYRGDFSDQISLSASLFFNHYNDLRSDDLVNGVTLPIMLENGIAGNTYGVEIWGDYKVTDWWKLSAGFNWLHKDLHVKPGHNDISLGQSEGQDPAWQAQLRSQMNISDDWEADIMLRAVDRVTRPFTNGQLELVPSYIDGDARIGWHITDTTELSLSGYNLLHRHHLEANDPSTYAPRYIDRTYFVNLRQSF
ncbi:MAG TPA: TonB-dependent receptor [Rhizomicrobium sp.]|jgi:iron complex outermembrane receptor protein